MCLVPAFTAKIRWLKVEVDDDEQIWLAHGNFVAFEGLVWRGLAPSQGGTEYPVDIRERRKVKCGSVVWVGDTFHATLQLVPTFGTHLWV